MIESFLFTKLLKYYDYQRKQYKQHILYFVIES